MTIDIETVLTDYEWAETSRPILTIAKDNKSAMFQMGSRAPIERIIEMEDVSPGALAQQFDGLRDLFEAAAELVRSGLNTSGDIED